MFVMAWRTISVRVNSDALIVFTPKDNPDDVGDESFSNTIRRLTTQFKEGWKNDTSLFSWADTGQWETTPLADEDTTREANWFRIGFEPLFVDFTQSGVWFILFSLGEVREIVAFECCCLVGWFIRNVPLYAKSRCAC